MIRDTSLVMLAQIFDQRKLIKLPRPVYMLAEAAINVIVAHDGTFDDYSRTSLQIIALSQKIAATVYNRLRSALGNAYVYGLKDIQNLTHGYLPPSLSVSPIKGYLGLSPQVDAEYLPRGSLIRIKKERGYVHQLGYRVIP